MTGVQNAVAAVSAADVFCMPEASRIQRRDLRGLLLPATSSSSFAAGRHGSLADAQVGGDGLGRRDVGGVVAARERALARNNGGNGLGLLEATPVMR